MMYLYDVHIYTSYRCIYLLIYINIYIYMMYIIKYTSLIKYIKDYIKYSLLLYGVVMMFTSSITFFIIKFIFQCLLSPEDYVSWSLMFCHHYTSKNYYRAYFQKTYKKCSLQSTNFKYFKA